MSFKSGKLMREFQYLLYEFQECKTLPSSEGGSKAHLLNLYQFSNAWLQLGVNILESATHLK